MIMMMMTNLRAKMLIKCHDRRSVTENSLRTRGVTRQSHHKNKSHYTELHLMRWLFKNGQDDNWQIVEKIVLLLFSIIGGSSILHLLYITIFIMIKIMIIIIIIMINRLTTLTDCSRHHYLTSVLLSLTDNTIILSHELHNLLMTIHY